MSKDQLAHTLVLNRDYQPISFLPLSTLKWQEAIKSIYIGATDVVHTYDDWVVSSPSCSINVPAVVILKKMRQYKRVMGFSDSMVFLRDNYTCQYCGSEFIAKELTVDHVVPKSQGGDTSFGNLVAACHSCNSKRGTNTKIIPKKLPYHPSYYEMVDRIRHRTMIIPHESWIDYLGWFKPDLLKVISPKN